MKKIFALLATASILFACDKTENEQDIIDTFFGSDMEANSPRPEVYDQMPATGTAYLQEFNGASASDWQLGKGLNDGTYSVSVGNYIISASSKGATGVWKDLPTGLSGNYQIDAYIKHVSLGSSAEQAILYGVTNGGKEFYFFGCKSVATTNMIIGKDENPNWYEKQRDLDFSSYHLYSVRKYNRKLYFFIDKSFIYSCPDFSFQNYGFYVGKSGIMHVDYVRVDYIDSK